MTAPRAPARSWVEFWNTDVPLYVNDRHKSAHAAGLARDIRALWGPEERPRLLDHGCGEALYAGDLVPACTGLWLLDAAPRVREGLAARHAGAPTVRVLAPEDLPGLAAESLDLVLANSLLQYLDGPTLAGLLEQWHRLLAPGGRLILADVIPPDVSPVTDAVALLRMGAREGFFLGALGGLIRTALSDYRALRGRLGLATHTEAELCARLATHGFAARRHHPNLGHNQARMTIEAVRT